MKKLLLICTLCAFTLGVYAQEVPTTPTSPKASTTKHANKHASHATTAEQYRCPKCDYSASERGDCPTDNVALIKVGTYYCKEHNNEVSTQPGKCSICGKKLTKMTAAKTKA
ncbi:heavy metal-binding domain-containing protein [Solitalea koreensis]|uniref:Heavy metal binding domain-containing protein n=1 Tax=Solitalea koreensis TaxID=543615 RepID=A0A521C4E8_9SPHI|nr:heavy metal-binding domain-containing protein [Solitalea koreensis]SMO54322.1 hypothetical protein SAMN06265350_103206 [Solitalea koreensis]